MALTNKTYYTSLDLGLRLVNNNGPIATTDEIACYISGTERHPQFTSLTDKLTSINTAVENIPTETTISEWGFTKNTGTVKKVNNILPDKNGNVTIETYFNTYFNVIKKTLTAFTPCGGNDTISGNNHKVTVVADISIDGSTITANTQQIDFSTLQNTLSSILTRLKSLEGRVSILEENGVTPTQVTVTFNANGGTCSITSLQVNVGSTIAVMPIPTKSGYGFLGWYNEETKYTTYTTINADVTLTAKWQAETKYAVITTPPTGKKLTYNGQYQEIINGGEGTNGILYYNTTASEYGKVTSVSDSSLKRINAGVYTAYYKFVANEGYTYTNSVWTPVTTTINKAKSSIDNPGNKTIKYGDSSVVTLSYTGLTEVNVSSSNTNIITASVVGKILTLRANSGSGSATITVNGTADNNYTTPTNVTFNATAAKANNSISIVPSDTVVNVVNGLYNGNSYYTISSISATSHTPSTISADSSSVYFLTSAGSTSSRLTVQSGSSVNAHFNQSENAKTTTVTIYNPGNDNYNEVSKTITFNFTKTTPTTSYKYYIGNESSDSWEPTSFSGLTTKSVASKSDFIGVTHNSNGQYIYIIIPSEWINNKTTGLATINMMKNSANFIVALYKNVITTFTDNGVKYSVISTNGKIAADIITIQNF